MDWTNRPDPGIKHYSGTVAYHKQFNWQDKLAKGQRLLLDLGEVDVVATAQINKYNLGSSGPNRRGWTSRARRSRAKTV